MSGTQGFGGGDGGVNAAIPLAAGRIGQQDTHSFANNPLAFIDAMTRMQQLKLLPGQLQLQQQELQSGQQSIQSNAVKLAQQGQGAAAAYLRSLLGQDNVSHDDVVRVLGAAHGSGINTDGLIDRLASYNPPNGNYKGFVNENLLPTMSEAGVLQALTPRVEQVPAGGEVRLYTQPGLTSGRAGTLVPQGSVTVTPTQAQLMQPVDYTDAEGVPQHTNLAEYNRRLQGGEKLGPASPSGGPNPLLGPVTPGVNGQPDLRGGGGSIPGPAPGLVEAATIAGRGNAGQALALQTSSANLPMQKAVLGNLEASLTNFTSGPGSDWMNVGASFVNKINPFFNTFDPSRIRSQDEFRKQALTLAQEQFKALHGTGTDAQLASTSHTSPNDFLSNQSNIGIIHFLKGNVDAQAVMNAEWQKWLPLHKNDPGTYGQFVTEFNKSFDPRVFQSVYADPAEKQTMLKGMTSKEEREKFQADFNAAVDKGWIPDPRARGG